MATAETSIISKVEEIVELKKMIEDLTNEAEALSDEVKAYMDAEELDTMMAGSHKVSYKEVISKRIDTPALKKLLGDALDPYFKVVASRRFSVA